MEILVSVAMAAAVILAVALFVRQYTDAPSKCVPIITIPHFVQCDGHFLCTYPGGARCEINFYDYGMFKMTKTDSGQNDTIEARWTLGEEAGTVLLHASDASTKIGDCRPTPTNNRNEFYFTPVGEGAKCYRFVYCPHEENAPIPEDAFHQANVATE